MVIKVLDGTTVRQLHSGQVIVDIEAIIKELLENSLDADATSIEVTLTGDGLDSVLVKDNGKGIEKHDIELIGRRYHTSKLTEFSDLEKITTFGFRGEAINSICSICNSFYLTTKTAADPISTQYSIHVRGEENTIINEKSSSNVFPVSGTLIVVNRPFHDLPVRRQLQQSNVLANNKKIRELITKYALSYPQVRLSLQYSTTKKDAWIKPVTSSIENTISILFSTVLSGQLERNIKSSSESLTIHSILPKSNSDPNVVLKSNNIFVYVNRRPIQHAKSELKEVIAMIKSRYNEAIGLNDTSKKTPFIYLDIQLPPNEYDVNIEPNKSTVLFHHKQAVNQLVESILNDIFPQKSQQTQQSVQSMLHHAVEPPLSKSSATVINTTDNNHKDTNWNLSMVVEGGDDNEVEQEHDKWQIASSIVSSQVTTTLTPQKRSIDAVVGDIHAEPLVVEKHLTTVTEREVTPIKQVLSTKYISQPRASKNTTNPTTKNKPSKPKPVNTSNNGDLVSLFNKQRQKNQQQSNMNDLCNTLNQKMTIDCDFDDIRATYPRRKQILAETYRIRIDDYLKQMSTHQQELTTVKLLSDELGELAFYCKTSHDRLCELGAVKIKPLYTERILQHLIEEYKLVCKKPLDRPVQIEMLHQDPLCPVLLSLKHKQQLIKDDLHGQRNITYNEITDVRMINNGFKVRWRNCDHAVIIQFTAVVTEIPHYDIRDFKELLSIIATKKNSRPTKVMQYFTKLAHEMYCQQDLRSCLSNLNWQEDDDWRLGFSLLNENHILACSMNI